MAEFNLKDGEFWLPPQFLVDDEIPMKMNPKISATRCVESDFTIGYLPSGFESFGFSSSDLSSPVESVIGSTETESDEEDYLAGLTRQMAHSTLEDCVKKQQPNYGFASENTKAWVMSGSPQSTLCNGAMGCGCKRQCSSRGSPKSASPPLTPAAPSTWDLLYAAAGEVAKMPYSDSTYYSRQPLFQERQMNMQLLNLKEEYLRKQLSQAVWGGNRMKGGVRYQVCNQDRMSGEIVGNRTSRPMGMTWPPLQPQQQPQSQPQPQQQNGATMRAVFLGTNAARKECAGTGVFLPRRAGYPAEPRKKSGCSTVLVPARVAQALNLKLDDMGGAQSQFQSRYSGSFSTESDVALRHRTNNMLPTQQKHNTNNRSQPAISYEIRLPQEWTY